MINTTDIRVESVILPHNKKPKGIGWKMRGGDKFHKTWYRIVSIRYSELNDEMIDKVLLHTEQWETPKHVTFV